MTNTLLPPNATALERAVASTSGRIDALPTPLRDVWSPADCPVDALPWLAWSFGVEDWSADWSEQQRRAVIDQAIPVKRHRGTIGAVQLAINALGLSCRVQEWFNQIPAGDPYTYNMLLDVSQSGCSLPQLRQMLATIERTKNLRSHLNTIYPSVTAASALVMTAVASVGCEITVLMTGSTDISDVTAPTLVISSDVSSLGVGTTALITFTFSENISSFEHSDITVSGGTLGPLSGSGLVRTATFTAGDAEGIASIAVATGSYTDTAFPSTNSGIGYSLELTINPGKVVFLLDELSDRSPSAHAVFINGNVQASNEKSKFGKLSTKFTWPNSYLSINSSDDFNFNNFDFTIEADIYLNSAEEYGHHHIIVAHDDISTTRGWLFFVSADANGKLSFAIRSNGNDLHAIYSHEPLSINIWHKVAVCRSKSSLTLFLDDAPQETINIESISFNEIDQPLLVGALKNAGSIYAPACIDGYIQNLCIEKFRAKYT